MDQKIKMVWEYQGKQFPNKKDLCLHFRLSTCKFEGKLKDKEIIKLTQQAGANGNITKKYR